MRKWLSVGVLLLAAGPLSAGIHRKPAHSPTIDEKIILLQRRIDMRCRHMSSQSISARLAERYGMSSKLVLQLRRRLSWGQTAVYLAFADQMVRRDSQMTFVNALAPLQGARHAGLRWEEIAREYHVAPGAVLETLAWTRLNGTKVESQLAERPGS